MMHGVWRQLGRIRRRFSRNEWVVRWLGLSRVQATDAEPGLILVQIDGLSRKQFERALKNRRMPFLRRLLKKRGYQIHSMYSGLPSSTPAVQGEIFYGVRCAVPAFGFRDPETNRIVAMFDNAPAVKVENRLAGKGHGLLAGGSAYSNIYSGGAAEPHFCASTFGWGMIRRLRPSLWVSIIVWHAWSVVRMITLVLIELVIALGDAIYGQFKGHSLWRELRFVPARVAVSIGLRELITIGASLDVTRGLPVVQLNYLGYDEQSHRRGPSSKFAHWSLKGIDDSIKRVATAARRSQQRRYELWVYSDHGQEKTVQYSKRFGRTIHAAIAELFGEHVKTMAIRGEQRGGRASSRSQWLKRKNSDRAAAQETVTDEPHESGEENKPVVEVVSLGPVGHIYPPTQLSNEDRETLAKALVDKCGIPMVVVKDGNDQAKAWTPRGCFQIPEQTEELFSGHPFLPDLGEDLACLAHHPCSGEFIIIGWDVGVPPMSFANENGSHAGPAPEETHGFMLLPPSAPLPSTEHGYYRPSDLRESAMQAFSSVHSAAAKSDEGAEEPCTITKRTSVAGA